MKNRGIIYIAIGSEYRSMAIRSAESIISNYVGRCPQIIIFCDIEDSCRISPYISLEQIQLYCPANPAIATAYLKTKLNYISKFSETLYLDSDTKAIGDMSHVWEQISDSMAVAPAYNPIQKHVIYPNNSEAIETSKCLSEVNNYTQYNTGVLLFQSNLDTNNIFKLWSKEWQKFKHHENMAFARLTTRGINVNCLDSKYNQFYPDVDSKTILIHYVGGYKKILLRDYQLVPGVLLI